MKVEIDKIPESVEDFLLVQSEMAMSEYGAVTFFILALKIYSSDPEVGGECLKNALTGAALNGGEMLVHEKARLEEQLKRYPHIVDVYFSTSLPENGYNPGDLPYEIEFKELGKTVEGDSVKVFVKTSGADSARPVRVEKGEEGIWKVSEFSSLLMGVRDVE